MPATIERVPEILPSEITSLALMFARTTSFNQDLSIWDTSHVTNMDGMFNGNISNWDVSHVTRMKSMFYYGEKFNGNISKWNVSNVRVMTGMFANAWVFNQDLSNWDVSNVKEHDYFNSGSGIDNPNKLPNFPN